MGVRLHTVRPGENLATIAEAYYGNPELASFIFVHNTNTIESINAVYPMQTIVIPHLSEYTDLDYIEGV